MTDRIPPPGTPVRLQGTRWDGRIGMVVAETWHPAGQHGNTRRLVIVALAPTARAHARDVAVLPSSLLLFTEDRD